MMRTVFAKGRVSTEAMLLPIRLCTASALQLDKSTVPGTGAGVAVTQAANTSGTTSTAAKGVLTISLSS